MNVLIKGTTIIGKPVITLDEGKKIEDIDDVIYDPGQNRVQALLVHGKGLFSDAKVLLLEDIQGLGEDAVLVASKDVLKKSSNASQLVSGIAKDGTYLTHHKIISENGRNLGTVTDIYFDPKTGIVEELEVSKGLEDIKSGKKRIMISDVVTVGKDAIIVKSYTEEGLKEQAKYGGAQGAVTKGVRGVKEKLQTFTEQAKEKVEDVRSHPRTQQIMQSAREKVRETKENLREKSEKRDR